MRRGPEAEHQLGSYTFTMHAYIKGQLQRKQVQAAILSTRICRNRGSATLRSDRFGAGFPWPAAGRLRPSK